MFFLEVIVLLLPSVNSHSMQWRRRVPTENNKGYESYLSDNTTEFHNLPLTWASNNSIPDWLQGSYVKNGPARKQFGNERYYSNYLDSWGKLHKFTFNGPDVKFSGRMIETACYNKSIHAGKMVPTITLAHVEPKDWTQLEMVEGAMNGYDNTNVMLWKLGPEDKNKGLYIATTDFPEVHEIDPETLAVKQELGISLVEGISLGSCSHWRREVGKDSSLNFHMNYNLHTEKQDFVLYRFGDSWEDHHIVGKFQMPHMSIVHMFSNTVNYAVVAIYPVTMDYLGMLSHDMHPFETIKKIDSPTYFYLMDLRDGTVIDGFESEDPILIFSTHHVNAWEEEDEVVFDLACNPWNALKDFMNLETMLTTPETNETEASFVMKRVRLNLNTKAVSVEDWPHLPEHRELITVDFPTINNDFTGYKNRFAYGWLSVEYVKNKLVKKDLEDPANDKTWSYPSHYPGESFFVPRPDGQSEDDGVVLNIVFDGEKKKSYLLVLDGQSFQEINRAYLPINVPFSFHGNWFPELH